MDKARQQAIDRIAVTNDPHKLLKTLTTALHHTRLIPGFDYDLEAILKREFVRMVDALIVEAKTLAVKAEQTKAQERERVRTDILNFRAVRRSERKGMFLEVRRVSNEKWHPVNAKYLLLRGDFWVGGEAYANFSIKHFDNIHTLLTAMEEYGDWHEWQGIEPENVSYRNRQEVNQENE